MGQDLQRLLLIKFWARHWCQIIGKTFMALRFTEAITKCQRDDAFCVLSRPITCHSPLTPLRERRGKAIWCWGPVEESTKAGKFKVVYRHTSVSVDDIQTSCQLSFSAGYLAPGPSTWPWEQYWQDQCQCICLKCLAQCWALCLLLQPYQPPFIWLRALLLFGRNSAWNNEYARHMPNNNELLDYLNGTVGSRADGPSWMPDHY